MRALLFIISLSVFVVGCGPPKAPAVKRTIDAPLDELYLKSVFAASVTNHNAQLALSNSVRQVVEHIAEFRNFMSQVEVGKIRVEENMKKGGWQSFLNNGVNGG